jgi:endoglucanase
LTLSKDNNDPVKTICRILLSGLLLLANAVSLVVAQEQPAAATLVDDFDASYEDDFAAHWWTYSDDSGSTFAASLDSDLVYNGSAALRLDVRLVAAGYAGTGFDFSFAHNWNAGQGILLRIRASAEGLPMSLVLHLQDPTQTSTESPGVTPFGCKFTTPPGSAQDWATVTVPWSCFERLTWLGTEGVYDFTPNPVVKFEVAFETAEDQTLDGSIWIDDIRVISDTDLNEPPSVSEILPDLPVIRASQVGYRPDDRKWFVATIPTSTFSVVNDSSGDEVFSGTSVHWGFDEDPQQDIYRGDFQPLTEPGTYRLVLDTGDESYPITIGEDVYAAPLILAARALYLQRSGLAIHDAGISGVELDAGHLEPAVLWDDPDGAPFDVSGGWYDAGDFGRYIPTAAFAVNQLLYAFNANPDFFGDGSLNIPESGNGLPDLLDEIRWELDWLLKMQRADGAVHHKVTTRSFPDFGTLPAEDTSQLYVFDVSSADTAYFAAVTAQAAHTFTDYDAEYADTLLAAAQRAWAWLAEHPEQVPPGGFHNPPVSEYPMQGGYDFVGVEDVPRMWAAAELFRVTGDSTIETAFSEYFRAVEPDRRHTMSWANVYPMALYGYLTAEDANAETREAVVETFQNQAEMILDVTGMSGYDVALNDREPGFEFEWGSNQVALAHGLYLMLANNVFPPDVRFSDAALSQIQYVLGVNPLAKAYISGIGANPMLHPHHNVSYRMQRAVPGFITEGANSQNAGGDAVLEGLWEMGVPAAMRYSDDWQSWASNEPTIDANATFVALLAHWASAEP